MNQEHLLTVLYDLAMVMGAEVQPRPLITHMLQRLMAHTGATMGLYLRDTHLGQGPAGEDALLAELERALGNRALGKREGARLALPPQLLHSPEEALTPLLSALDLPADRYKALEVMAVPGSGLFLLCMSDAQAQPGLTQAITPVLSNFSKTLALCRSNEAFTTQLEGEKEEALGALARFRAALDTTDDAVFLIDPAELRYVDFNEAVVNAHGYSREALSSMGPQDLCTTHDAENLRQLFVPLLEGRSRELRLRSEHRRRDGSVFPVEIRLSALRDGPSPLVIALARDISEQIRVEAALRSHRDELEQKVADRTRELALARDEAVEATQAKSAFLATMSHELRTPLNSIIGFSGILADGLAGALNPEQGRQIGMVYDSARHLLGLVNDILDLSKVEANRMEVHLQQGEVDPLMNEVSQLMRPQADAKGLELRLENCCAGASLYADFGRARQVLLNLLSNAVKFTRAGSVTLRCRREETMFAFEVTDTGIGIPADQLGRVFDTFTQVDDSYARAQEGTGLGLALSRQLVELMGGTLSATSEAGAGSTFTMRLPFTTETEAPAEPEQSQGNSALLPAGGTLLVVDDTAADRELLCTSLRGAGFEIVQATSADEAYEAARSQRPDAICVDLVMPGTDGWELLERLKDDPLTAQIPVLVISSLDEPTLASSLGAAAFLRKPVERQTLIQTLDEVVGHAHDILVVDDSPTDRRRLAEFLAEEGYIVREAPSGPEALRIAEELPPDLLVIDLAMPEMSGFELVRRVQGLPATRNIPIFVLTGRSLSDPERRFLERHTQLLSQKDHDGYQALLSRLRAVVPPQPQRYSQ